MIEADSSLPEELLAAITPKIESFLTRLKCGSPIGDKSRSLSTEAAMEMVKLFSYIIECFQDFENTGNVKIDDEDTEEFGERSLSFANCGSPTLQMRQQRIPEVQIASSQVQRLLLLISRTSRVLIRPQFGTLLLTNVTRRVLSIVREAAAEARATEGEIEQWDNCSPLYTGCEDVVLDMNKEPSLPGKGDTDDASLLFTLDKGPAGSQVSRKKESALPLPQLPGARPYLSPAVGKGSAPPRPLMSPLLGEGGEGGGAPNRSHKDAAAPRSVLFSKERGGGVQGSGGAHSGASSFVITTPVPPGATDTEVSVPGQHVLRRTPSLRDPTSDSYFGVHNANLPVTAAGSSSPDRVFCNISVTSSRSNSFGTPPRSTEKEKTDLDGGGRLHSDVPSPPPSSSSSSVFVSCTRKVESVPENPRDRVTEETSSGVGEGGDAGGGDGSVKDQAEIAETVAPSFPSSYPFSVVHEFPVRLKDFYNNCITGLTEFASEIDTMTSELCNSVNLQIHRDDVLITIGYTHTLREYLLAASKESHFRVLLLEGDPTPQTMLRQFAADLAEKDIEVHCLPDSAAFAVMNTCTKVVVGAESVLANGGMLAPIGTRMLCVAARHFSVPVLVPTTTLKMSPYYPSDSLCSRLVRITKGGAHELPWSIYGGPERVLPLPHGMWIDVSSPSQSASIQGMVARGGSRSHEIHMPLEMKVSFAKNPARSRPRSPSNSPSNVHGQDGEMEKGPSHLDANSTTTGRGWAGCSLHETRDSQWGTSLILSQVFVHCAAMEYVPPELVTLYATNESEYTPSQCHRVTRANYNDAD